MHGGLVILLLVVELAPYADTWLTPVLAHNDRSSQT